MPTALFLYYLLFFAAAFAWPTWRVWKRHGVNPLVLPRDDSAYGLIGAWFKVLMLGLLAMLGGLAFGVPERLIAPLDWLSLRPVEVGGWTILTISMVWIVSAQLQMGRSWRIGIDRREQPPLVQEGLFRLSRNPIFLGMRANLLGLFMVLPNAHPRSGPQHRQARPPHGGEGPHHPVLRADRPAAGTRPHGQRPASVR